MHGGHNMYHPQLQHGGYAASPFGGRQQGYPGGRGPYHGGPQPFGGYGGYPQQHHDPYGGFQQGGFGGFGSQRRVGRGGYAIQPRYGRGFGMGRRGSA